MNRFVLFTVLYAVASCRSGGLREETIINARPMAGSAPIAYGDCVEARKRALAKPDLDVDSVPRPVSQRPRPFANMPASVSRDIDTKGSSVKIDVIVDTLGRADMKTFRIVQSSNPWLAQSLKTSLPTWTFRAARLAGCKVPRVFHFSATSKPRKGR